MLGDGIADTIAPETLLALSSRAALLAREGDHVVMDTAPDPDWIALLASLGISGFTTHVPSAGGGSLCERVLGDPRLMDTLSSTIGTVEPYMGAQDSETLAALLGAAYAAPPSTMTRSLNHKATLNALLERTGLSVIPTMTATRRGLIRSVEDELSEHGPQVVRADISIGGHGVWSVASREDLDRLRSRVSASPEDRVFLIQPKLDVVRSPNVQFLIDQSGGVTLVGVSDQTLTPELAFVGNTFPSASSIHNELVHDARLIADRLAEEGYKGYMGVDFIETRNGYRFVIEINPRVNTSTFAHAVRERVGASAFELAVSVPCADEPCRSMAPWLMRPGTDRGVVPVTPRSNAKGRVDLVVLAPTAADASALAAQVRQAQEDAACSHT